MIVVLLSKYHPITKFYDTWKCLFKKKAYCSSCVKDFHHALLAIYLDLFSVTILNSWIVFLDENTLNKLNCQCWFTLLYRQRNNNLWTDLIYIYIIATFHVFLNNLPNTSTTKNDYLILLHYISNNFFKNLNRKIFKNK